MPKIRPRWWGLLIALVVVIGACSSSGGESSEDGGDGASVSAVAYADAMCTEISTWLQGIIAGAQDVPSLDPAAKNAEKVRDAFATYLQEVIDNTETLTASLGELDTPDVEGGEEFTQNLASVFQGVTESLTQYHQQVEGLSTDNVAAFRVAMQQIGANIQSSFNVDPLSNVPPELDEAAAQSESCAALQGASEAANAG